MERQAADGALTLGRGPWVVVGCGALKRPEPAPAIDLYVSNFARAAAAWALSVTTRDRVLVLSAKHGLVDADTVLAPYDVSFTGPASRLTSDPVVVDDLLALQAARREADGFDGEVLTTAGKVYRDRLARATGGQVRLVNPFLDHLRGTGAPLGIGSMTQAMNASRGQVPGQVVTS